MKQFKTIWLITLILLPCILFNAQAQPNAEVSWSKMVKLGFSGIKTTNFLGEIDDHIYVGSGMASSRTVQVNNKISFIKLNADLRIVKESEFKLEGPEGNRTHTATIIRDGEIYLFTRKKDDEKYSLYLETIDKSTLQPAGDRKKIMEAIGSTGLLSISTGGDFQFYSSPDSSKWLVAFVGGDSEKSYQYWVLDKSFNQLWSKSGVVANNDDFDVNDLAITNDGNIFMFVDQSTSGGIFNKPEFEYAIYGFFEEGKSQKKFKIGKKNHSLNNPNLVALGNNTVGLAGFYQDKEKESNVGAFFISVDEVEQELKTREYTSFGADFLAYGNTSGQQRRIKRRVKKGRNIGLHPIWTRDVVRREDGGLIIAGEEFDRTSYNSTVSGGNNSNYEFDDIYLINYDPNGSIRWQKKVPKIQTTSRGLLTAMSFSLVTVDDHVHLLFNDNEDNANYKGPENPKSAILDAAMLLVSIDGAGNTTRSICDDMDDNLHFVTGPTRKIGNNNIFVLRQQMGNFKFGKIVITNQPE